MKSYFKRLNKTAENFAIKADIAVRKLFNSSKEILKNNDGWGKDEVIAIAAALVIAGFVMIPKLKELASSIVSAADSWFTNTMQSKIFPTTMP